MDLQLVLLVIAAREVVAGVAVAMAVAESFAPWMVGGVVLPAGHLAPARLAGLAAVHAVLNRERPARLLAALLGLFEKPLLGTARESARTAGASVPEALHQSLKSK
jgi:hypothetical protein